MEALENQYKLKIGDPAPSFDLPGVDGKRHALESYADKPVLVVGFTCNHCPYVQAYEGRLIEFQKSYGPRGVQLVTINSNETENYPEDSFDRMVERARKLGFTFPYLRDEDQSIATAYGAVCTPHTFVFDGERKLRYQGRIDENKDNPARVKSADLRKAVEALLAGTPVPTPLTRAFGCSIKWGPGPKPARR